MTAELVSAYLKNIALSAADIPQLAQHVPELIHRVHEAFARLPASASGEPHVHQAAEGALGMFGLQANDAAPTPGVARAPAVPIEESVTDDYVVCLEDGLMFRSLRPHLVSSHGLTPEAYRRKWGLAHDHPIVAPNYSHERSMVAKKIGLGKGGRGASPGQPRKAE